MSRGRDPEDMGNSVGPLPSLNHIPSSRSTDSGRRPPVEVLTSVHVSTHEDSLSVDGNGVLTMVLVYVCSALDFVCCLSEFTNFCNLHVLISPSDTTKF